MFYSQVFRQSLLIQSSFIVFLQLPTYPYMLPIIIIAQHIYIYTHSSLYNLYNCTILYLCYIIVLYSGILSKNVGMK